MRLANCKFSKMIIAGALVLTISPAGPIGEVFASDNTDNHIEDAIRNISDISEFSTSLEQTREEFSVQYSDSEMSIDKGEPDIVSIKTDSGFEFEIGLPEADDLVDVSNNGDLITYDANEGDYSVSTETVDGVVRNCFIF